LFACLPKTIAIVLCLFPASLLFGSKSEKARPQKTAKVSPRPDLLFVQADKMLDGNTPQRFPRGSRIVRLAPDSKRPRELTPEFFAAADPQVDFSGAKILFSAQKNPDAKWQIWEMNADGSEKRQITNCTEDCLRAAYLPEGEIVFTVESEKSGLPESYLAVSKTDGSEMHRITFGPGNFWLETVLRDGRVLASASSPLQESAAAGKTRLLYTLRPDGAALEAFRCEHQSFATRGDAAELEDGSVIFVRRAGANGTSGGALAEVRKGDPGESAVGSRAAKYRSPRPLSAGSLIVSRTSALQGAATPKFDLYEFDLKKHMDGSLIYSDPKLSSIQAVPLVANPVPKRFWSTLNMDSKTGYLISLNSYDSSQGEKGRLKAAIARVRVMSLEGTAKQEHSLGEAPVEKDGSFYVEVPANQPVRFELLDANGKTIVAERSWIWTRPGEQRGCPGCHGDKALAPENRWPLTLKRFDTPTALLEKNDAAEAAHAH
jgi:Hydrazine synthase alpha subunit middle domain